MSSYRAAYCIGPRSPAFDPALDRDGGPRARAFDEAALALSWAHAVVRARSPDHQPEVARRRTMDRDHPYRSGPDLVLAGGIEPGAAGWALKSSTKEPTSALRTRTE